MNSLAGGQRTTFECYHILVYKTQVCATLIITLKNQQRQPAATCRLFGENRKPLHNSVHIRLTENIVDGRVDLLLAVRVAR